MLASTFTPASAYLLVMMRDISSPVLFVTNTFPINGNSMSPAADTSQKHTFVSSGGLLGSPRRRTWSRSSPPMK